MDENNSSLNRPPNQYSSGRNYSGSTGDSKAIYLILGIFAGIVGFLVFSVISCSVLVSSMAEIAGKASDFDFETIAEEMGEKKSDEEKEGVGVVEITGAIFDSKKPLEHLRRFSERESIKAIVVRVDSPGGAVGPSQEIFREIKKAREKKKVVISMGALAASGGFYVAMAGDKIYAMPGSITGSIGVISEFTYVRELLDWMKVKPKVYKSGKFKDAATGLRELTPEDDALFQGIVMDIYEQFLRDVAESRNLPISEIRAIADGRVLTASQAKELKLIDEFGNIYDAADAALRLAGIEKKARLVYPRRDKEDLLMELFSTASIGLYNLLNVSPKKPAMAIMENKGY
ncbi:MAG: hypothetical protein Kow0090_00500 [Myxococcota bacterium]